MRYVSSIPPVATGPNSRLVSGLSAVHAVKPVHSREPAVDQVEQQAKHEEKQGNGLAGHRDEPFEERRKACRRILKQKVLIELRTGVERRQHDRLGNAPIGHIDETV